MVQVPEGSIYIQMYRWGLARVPLRDIEFAVKCAGKNIRKKDYDNYWNGWYRANLYCNGDAFELRNKDIPQAHDIFRSKLSDYPVNPYKDLPEIQNRWVPCNEANKPMIKWSNGCLTLGDAMAYPHQVWLAENLKGTTTIVLDIDGDHGDRLDIDTINAFHPLINETHCLMRPNEQAFPISYHLTFETDRLIPTMHFPYAHLDIAGNAKNQLRYLKNKWWNGIRPAMMTDELWEMVKDWLKYRNNRSKEEQWNT